MTLLDARFEEVARLRPVDPVVEGVVDPGGFLAPYVAVRAPVAGTDPVELWCRSGSDRLVARWDGTAGLEVTVAGRTTRHRSRRHGRPDGPVAEVALALTGTHLTVLTRTVPTRTVPTREAGGWVARGRVDLAGRLDTRDETWLAGLDTGASVDGATAGGFGQLGLRDLRLVSNADGTAYRPDGRLLLTATSAGPGFFDTAHTSVWELATGPEPALAHRADLFFRRPDRPGAYGDHATHLVRDGDRWLVATSTWGDFDRARPMRVTLAETTLDVTRGRHLLDTRPLDLPSDGVGVWDPHLVRDGDGWLVGYVSAERYFRFAPALAAGPTLDALAPRGLLADRRSTEGTTLVRDGGRWLVLASDGRDNRAPHRAAYPALDLDLRPVGHLDAPYPTNIPWPSVVPDGDGWLLVTFDGTPTAGPLTGYGTHGDLVVMRSV